FVVRKNFELPCFDCHQEQISSSFRSKTSVGHLNIRMAIKEVLLSMDKDVEGRKALQAIGNASSFIGTTDKDYSELFRMIEDLHLNPRAFLDARDKALRSRDQG
ncbi:MAG: hypothetical protein HY801_10040, partial [Candidatus Lindowbacteria bacterium]|nr:hypothetical protein [Candidatus Lindowbacteria bacterium]